MKYGVTLQFRKVPPMPAIDICYTFVTGKRFELKNMLNSKLFGSLAYGNEEDDDGNDILDVCLSAP